MKKSFASIPYLTIIITVILILSTRGINDESTVALNGDMPRYVMNGVYFHDLVKDLPLTNPLEYTLHYYARYPAISIGHHPILLGIAEAPFFALCGISIFSARLTIVAFTIMAAVFWYFLICFTYKLETTAFISSLLLFTTPFMVEYYRIVMSEIPALSCMITTVYFFYKSQKSNNKIFLWIFIISFAMMILARQQTIFMVPVFLGALLVSKRHRSFMSKGKIITAIILLLSLIPVIIITIKYSPSNIDWITYQSILARINWGNILYYFRVLTEFHVTLPVFVTGLYGIYLSGFYKDKRAIIFGLWIICSYLLITSTGAQAPGYNIYWIPPYCLFSATVAHYAYFSKWKGPITLLFYLIAGIQFAFAFQQEPQRASGYEDAARYVVEEKKGESVLVSTAVDTGYFSFFVRKHDPNGEMIVLRADKLLATSKIRWIVENRIKDKEEIYDILQNFGIGYVIIEDVAYQSVPLEWLRQELQTEKFILRKRIPINTDHWKLKKATLAVYEYTDFTPSKPDTFLEFSVPIIKKKFAVEFDDIKLKSRN